MQNLDKQYRIGRLITLHLGNKLSETEKTELDDWINSSADNAAIFQKLTEEKRLAAGLRDFASANTAQALLAVKTRIYQSKAPRIIKLNYWLRAAAILLAIISIGVIYTQFNYHFILKSGVNGQYQDLNAKNDLPAGGNRAFITLANGKSINLSSAKTGVVIDAAKLTYNDGTAVSATRNHVVENDLPLHRQVLTITTPYGGQYQIKLPDGTSVYMNAGSTLTFPLTFKGLKERKLILTGEAYFTVVHNDQQPFRVQTTTQLVEDIGTEFNVNAYTDELHTKTTLVEGAAKVIAFAASASPEVASVLLTPGKQSILSNNKLTVKHTDITEAIAWKNGYFRFNDEKIVSIMKKIARWYNVEVTYDGKVSSEGFTGKVSRSKNISEVLTIFEKTKGVHFKIEGRRIIVIQ